MQPSVLSVDIKSPLPGDSRINWENKSFGYRFSYLFVVKKFTIFPRQDHLEILSCKCLITRASEKGTFLRSNKYRFTL